MKGSLIQLKTIMGDRFNLRGGLRLRVYIVSVRTSTRIKIVRVIRVTGSESAWSSEYKIADLSRAIRDMRGER